MASMSPEELKELGNEGASTPQAAASVTAPATPVAAPAPAEEPVAPIQAQAQLTAEQMAQI